MVKLKIFTVKKGEPLRSMQQFSAGPGGFYRRKQATSSTPKYALIHINSSTELWIDRKRIFLEFQFFIFCGDAQNDDAKKTKAER
jgi:hypothetical protein